MPKSLAVTKENGYHLTQYLICGSPCSYHSITSSNSMETDQKCTFLSLIPDSLTEKAWLCPEDCAVGSLNDSHAC